ncbi:MAG: cell wall-binding repeat-containing protein, partial [Coriobacteriia bacterium]
SIDATLTAYVAPGDGGLVGYVGSTVDGAPLEDIIVFASRYVAAQGGWVSAGEALTNENGEYEMTLEAGTYRLQFLDSGHEYLDEFYNNVYDELWDADDIVVTAEATTTIDVSLAPSGRIQGTVTAAGTGLPVAGVWVGVWEIIDGDWYEVASDYTAYDGTYDAYGLSPGEYIVEFYDEHGRYSYEYFDDTRDWYLATPIELGLSGLRTGVDAQLEDRGKISGTVTDSITGSPVALAQVTLWETMWGDWAWYSVLTDDNGHYEFTDVYNGSFLVSAGDGWYQSEFGLARYNEMFYLQEPNIQDATQIDVMDSSEIADFALSSTGEWGSISGKVLDSVTGAPVSDTYVVLHVPDGLGGYVQNYDYSTLTAADGSYLLNYVPLNADSYRVAAVPMGNQSALYDLTFYPSAPTADLGGEVDLSTSALLSNIDIGIDPVATVGWIQGLVVSEETSEPIAGIEVWFHNETGKIGRACTASDGTFARAVTEGAYQLQFTDPAKGYLGEWYDDTDVSNASSVEATASELTSVTASLTPAARISGTVRNAFGLPIEAGVTLYDSSGNYVNDVSTTAQGTYEFVELAAGTYSVQFAGWNGYASLWWNQQPTNELADDLVLTGGQVTSSIDATLPMGAIVSGNVTSDNGLLSGPVTVSAYRLAGSEWLMMDDRLAEPGDDWYYEFSGLLPGEYRFEFTTGAYPTIWYGSASTNGLAASVNLAAAKSAVVDQTLDGLPPSVESDVAGPYSKKATIEITATDSVSGVGSIFYTVDGGVTQTVSADSATVVVTTAGDRTLKYWAEDAVGNASEPVIADFTVYAEAASTSIAGDNRYQTAVAVSEEAFPDHLDPDGNRTVVIATGLNWPDALGGAALAGVLDGPILLVHTASVPASVTAEITRLGADKAIILGAKTAVSLDVERALESQLGGTDKVDRIAGDNRYETADLIAERVITEQGESWDHTAFVATGDKFPDALGAAPLAASKGWPLFLSHPTKGILPTTKARMTGVESVIVLGSESAVSKVVYDGLAKAHTDVVRLQGLDRYDTAVKIATYGVTYAGLGWDKVAITTGLMFPDALAGGVLQGKVGSVMLLTKPTVLNPYTKAALQLHKGEIFSVTYLGGTSAVQTVVRDQVSAALMP